MSFNFKALSEKNVKPNPVLEPGFANPPAKSRMLGLKLAIIFSFFLSLAALAGAGILFNGLTAEKQQRQVLEASHAQLRQKSEVFEKSSNQYKEAAEKIKSELETFSSEKTALKKQLDESLAQIDDLRSKIKLIQEKSRAIEETAGSEILESGADSDSGLNFAPVEGAQSEDAPSASPAPSAVAPAKIPAAAPSKAQPLSKDAKVLSVNRKFNFAVVNIGLSQKLKIGDVLQVMREGKPVARLQVEKLYEGFCAASIVQENKEAPVKEGDIVKPVV